jgi:hypothetical protein
MTGFHLRTDLQRYVIGSYALPLGLVPRNLAAPTQGYTVEYLQGEDDEPDTYSFHIVVSLERIGQLLDRLFTLLPREVYGIVEIGRSRANNSCAAGSGIGSSSWKMDPSPPAPTARIPTSRFSWITGKG